MPHLHTAIVLRTASVSKHTTILLDEVLGKIEGIASTRKGAQLSHGALISFTVKKKGMSYFLQDVQLLDMPLYWARENFLFFHHVLELCHHFLPWDESAGSLFKLMQLLYTEPETLNSPQAQKVFLYHFYKRLGMHKERGTESVESWLKECLREHPQVYSLTTAHYLRDVYEEAL